MKSNQSRPTRARRKRRSAPPYPIEFRLRIVRLYLQECYSPSLLNHETGVSIDTIYKWIKLYRKFGEDGLKMLRRGVRRSQIPPNVKGRAPG